MFYNILLNTYLLNNVSLLSSWKLCYLIIIVMIFLRVGTVIPLVGDVEVAVLCGPDLGGAPAAPRAGVDGGAVGVLVIVTNYK